MRRAIDRYVERLLLRRRPGTFRPTDDNLAVARTAIDLAAAAPDAGQPSEHFVEDLRRRVAALDAEPPDAEPPRHPVRTPVRRRPLLRTALAAVSAAVGGVGIGRLTSGSPQVAAIDAESTELLPQHGRWQTIAATADLPPNGVLPFELGTVCGFVDRHPDGIRAVSGICTHQGCRLDLAAARNLLVCPCHGATFALDGTSLTHPRSAAALPTLPHFAARDLNGTIQVYAPDPDSGSTPTQPRPTTDPDTTP